jgi:hypothetical protein
MENFKLALFSVSEEKWQGAGGITTTNGNLFIYSGMPGKNEPHIRGMGILINKNIKDALMGGNLYLSKSSLSIGK